MKNIVILLLLTFNITFVYSQQKSIYGTFLFNKEVINYKYTSHPNNLYTLKFFKWEDNSNQIKSIVSIEDLEKILTLIELKKTIFSENGIDIFQGYDVTDLEEKISEAKSTIESYSEIGELLGTINEKSISISEKLEQIEITTIYSESSDSDKLENAKAVISEYQKVNDQLKKIVSTSKTNEKEISLYDIQIRTYKPVIEDLISGLIGTDKLTDREYVEELTTRIFYELKTRMEFFDYQPVAGNIILSNNQIELYSLEKVSKKQLKTERKDEVAKLVKQNPSLDKEKEEKRLKDEQLKNINQPKILKTLEIEKVELEFASGGIKNLMVYSKDPNENQTLQRIKFRNIMPFSISGKFDPEHFNDISLFVDRSTIKDEYKGSYILLSDFLRYDISLSNNNEDYSPADTVINLSQTVPIAQVLKSKTSKILSARTFTDLVGIDGQQPNGLIQIEVYKRFSLWTDYWQRFFWPRSKFLYTGWLSYIEPKFSITKIEENNRFLPLNRTSTTIPFSLNPLEVYRYQQFSFGIDLNVVNLNIQNYKSKFFLDLHYNIARTTGQDETNSNDQPLLRLNTSNFGPRLYFQLLPDSRFGFKVGYDALKQVIHTAEVTIQDPEKNWLGSGWFLANLKTNQNGSEMFFRLRFNHLLKDINTNFLEVQLGYAFDILKKN